MKIEIRDRMKQIIYLTVAMAGYVMAENPLNIPETLSGNQFDFILPSRGK